MPAEHVLRGRVAWVDTDAGGRIHFTAAFRWAEAAETSLMREAGLLHGWGDYPRRKVEAEYLRVLRFEDEFDLRLWVERLGTTSIAYAWQISCRGELCIRGSHVVVHVDRDGSPAALTERIRTALAG